MWLGELENLPSIITEIVTHAPEIINHWQTLITGGLAIVAAFITTRKIGQQIDQTQVLEDRRRQARLAAALATSPGVVNLLKDYAHQCGRFYDEIIDSVGPSGKTEIDLAQARYLPVFPIESLRYFNDIIENSETKISEFIARITKDIYEQRWRLNVLILNFDIPDYSWRKRENLENHIGRLLLDVLILEIHLSKIESYIRKPSDFIFSEITWPEIQSRLGLFLSSRQSKLAEMQIKWRSEEKVSPYIVDGP